MQGKTSPPDTSIPQNRASLDHLGMAQNRDVKRFPLSPTRASLQERAHQIKAGLSKSRIAGG